jgi:NAD(P)-dependent dehydrogenase (short-subunit alcohol dehydrogenase family)
MNIDLRGLRALVTGSTSGIGKATAIRLAECGAEVVVNGRTPERVDSAIAEIGKAVPGAKLKAAPGDISTDGGCKAVIAAAGEVDILVNNAAWIGFKPAFEIPDEDWTKSFEVNVLAGVRLTRHYGPVMKAKGWGRIVFISSESGIQIPTEMIHYGFSKAAELAVSRGFAQALKGTGVTVNAVLPGPTRTEALSGYVKAQAAQRGVSEEQVERDFLSTARPTTVLDRFTTPDEIANVVAFVCSREASAISGTPLRADGGVVQAIT